LIEQFLDLFFNLNQFLGEFIQEHGTWIYVLLFVIIFAETGFIVTPFLPGDSLLFAVGALTAIEGGLDLWSLLISLSIAAIIGDFVNYSTGYYFGPKIFTKKDSKLFNPKHLHKTEKFYQKYGPFTIVIARFVPIIRTFAPFVAGMAKMNRAKFITYNISGGLVWIFSFTLLGHYFGNLPFVKKNFQYVIIAIIIVSVLPIVIAYFKERNKPDETAA